LTNQYTKSTRNSSLELLRILCIILIIFHHYSVHGGFHAGTINELNWHLIFVQMMSMFGRIACSVFVLISGYFLITRDCLSKMYKKVFSLNGILHLYSLLIFAALVCFGYQNISWEKVSVALFPLVFIQNWFVADYILFSMFIPFLNIGLRKLDRKLYTRLILLTFLIWSFIPTITHYLLRKEWYFGDFIFFLVFYMTGAFIRLHADNLKYKNKYNFLITLCAVGLILLSVPGMDALALITGDKYYLNTATYMLQYSSFLGVIVAIFSFLYFKNITFYNQTINRIAQSVLGIYLIHDGMARSIIWTKIWPNVDYFNSRWLPIHALVKCAAVFLICLAIDQIRLKTIHPVFSNWLDRNYPVMESKWNKYWSKLESAMFKVMG
jgi:surface polysaccharide O-acyltransferase-like enzyme